MRHRFTAAAAGRLDRLIADNTSLSRKRAKVLVKRGGVRIDGKPARFESTLVDAGAIVEVRTNAVAADSGREDIALPARYREAGILVVDKPAGLPSQPTRQGRRRHLYGALQAREEYVGLHHRLDTPASGLVLVTLDRGLNKAISEGFKQSTIHRRYLMVVVGDPGKRGRWSAPIDGQPAATRWQRLARGDFASVLAAELETGRTHQIRRHASEAGHPILGDHRYGGAAGRAWDRLALHAQQLRFHHPRLDRPITVDSPLPDDLALLFEQTGYGTQEE
ncbi:MAG: 23S rRNA pseudouridine1911/1915/1917 synthase [Myxococcota bacterium]|jgi:23S rRNA pseudouridine1911/1915/1917 synthase